MGERSGGEERNPLHYSLRSFLVKASSILYSPSFLVLAAVFFFCCFLMVTSGKRVAVIDFSLKDKALQFSLSFCEGSRCCLADLVLHQQISHLGLQVDFTFLSEIL